MAVDAPVLLLWHGTTQFGAIRDLSAFQEIRRETLRRALDREWLVLNLNLSSTDLEWIGAHDPEFLQALSKAIAAGRVELWTSGFSHNFANLGGDSWLRNLKLGLKVYEQLLGCHPSCFYPVELMFYKGLVRVLPVHGLDTCLFSGETTLVPPLRFRVGSHYVIDDLHLVPSLGRPTLEKLGQSSRRSDGDIWAFSHDWESRFCELRFSRIGSRNLVECVATPSHERIAEYFRVLDAMNRVGHQFVLGEAVATLRNRAVRLAVEDVFDARGVNLDDGLRSTGVTAFHYSECESFVHPVSPGGHRPVSSAAFETLPHDSLTARSLALIKRAMDASGYLAFSDLDASEELARKALAMGCSDWQTGASSETHRAQVVEPAQLIESVIRDATGRAALGPSVWPLEKLAGHRASNSSPGDSPVPVEVRASRSRGVDICSESPIATSLRAKLQLERSTGLVQVDSFSTGGFEGADGTSLEAVGAFPAGGGPGSCTRVVRLETDGRVACMRFDLSADQLFHLEIELATPSRRVQHLSYLSSVDGALERIVPQHGGRLMPFGFGSVGLELEDCTVVVAMSPEPICPAWHWNGEGVWAVVSRNTHIRLREDLTLEWYLVVLPHELSEEDLSSWLSGIPVLIE